MKIEINENESYEINFPEKITTENFIFLVERLKEITKIINKTPSTESKKEVVFNKKSHNTERIPFRNKEEVILNLKIYYFGTKEEKKELVQKYKYDDIIGLGRAFNYARKNI